MPDADWVLYRQIRGQSLPAAADLLQQSYTLNKILKRDFYAVVGVYDRASASTAGPAQLLLKVYHTDRLGILPLGWLGRWLCRREMSNLRQLQGVSGVPQLLAGYGPSGLVREFVPGCNLREFSKAARPDTRFFPRLRRILEAVHQRGMSHNDLSKPENVLVRPDGRPVLIDFQIALRSGPASVPGLGWLWRRIMKYMQGVDRYHLTKLHRRQRPEDFSTEDRAAARRKGWVLTVHGWVRRPYRWVRHLVLRKLLLSKQQPRS